MRILKKMLKQKAIYWEPKVVGQFGNVEFELPIDIKCRWTRGGEQMLDYEGKEFIPDHKVYSDRDLKEGGMLLEGEVKDLDTVDPPEDAIRIKKVKKLPTLTAKEFLRTNFL